MKTELWDRLGKTDPAHTKGFTRGGGFRGTAIKPMWSYRRMTEEFGPCGIGWGVNEPSFQVVPAGDEIMVFCTVSAWHTSPENVVYGVGGDKVVVKQSSGLRSDDEAFKKAFTDAVTNALKLIGVGADVHMGRFDDSKYVREITEEFAASAAKESEAVAVKSSAQLKRTNEWERVSKEIDDAMNDVFTFVKFEDLKATYRKEAHEKGWNKAFLTALKDHFEYHANELEKRIAAENNDVSTIKEAFPGARVTNEIITDATGRELNNMEAAE